jgi:hypothetical protein
MRKERGGPKRNRWIEDIEERNYDNRGFEKFSNKKNQQKKKTD